MAQAKALPTRADLIDYNYAVAGQYVLLNSFYL